MIQIRTLLLAFVVIYAGRRTDARPLRNVSLTTRIEHVMGIPMTPSPEIVAFVQNVENMARSGSDVEDSVEQLKPHEEEHAPNFGFSPYWPGGEWVYRKAEMDRCNSSDACHPMFKKYGKICGGNHDLSAHSTFDNFCEMMDDNCRDGTATQVTKPTTRSAAIASLIAKLQQALRDLITANGFNERVIQEQEESEQEIECVVRTNTTLKTQLANQDIDDKDMQGQRDELQSRVDQYEWCQEVHEQALQRIRDLEQQLEEVESQTNAVC